MVINFIKKNLEEISRKRIFAVIGLFFSLIAFFGGLAFGVYAIISLILLPSIFLFFVGTINPKYISNKNFYKWYLFLAFYFSIVFSIYCIVSFYLNGVRFSI